MDRQHKHPLRGLLVAQFFGAFNDSAWKLLVAGLAIRTLEAVLEGKPLEETETQKQFTIAFVVITLPLMIFSIPAGVLADRVSKRTVIFSMKVAEVLLMAAGTVMLWVSPAGGHGLLWILGLMGMQSAIFSPAKYGILPEVLPHDRLSAGNGLLELCTFVAIIAGTVVGPGLLYTVDELHLSTWIAGVVLTVLAVVGLVAATYVPRVPAARSEGGLGLTLRRAWGVLRADRVLRLSVLGQVFFWVIASCLGVVVLTYAKTDLKLDLLMGLPLAAFAIGIGAGSVLAGKLSHAKVEYGLIPLGALGLFVFTLLFGVIAPDETGTYVLMALMGVSSGFVVVPLNALLQWRSPVDRRGAVIALANVFVFAGILVGTLGAQWLANLGLHSREIFVATSLVVFVGTVWALWLLPDAFLRFVLVILTHTFYRLKVVGRDNVPQEGGVLLVPNHVSFVDGLFLMGSIDRPIRFLVESTYFHHPFLKPFMKALRAIPLSASGGARVILRALKDAGKHLDEGHVVCIFAEGQISRTGLLLPFRRGLERIVKGRSAPIVPVFLDRVWGSIFSWQGGRFLTKIPQRIPYRVTVAIGEPQPAGSSISDVRRAVLELGERSWSLRRSDRAPLHFSFVRGARRRPFSFAYADQQRPHVRRYQALAGAVALARALRSHWKNQQNVGILLPATVAGGLVNLAAALSGRTSVNLNFTAGRSGMEAAARQAELRTVVTSRAFLEKAKVELPEGIETIWIEDVGASIGVFQRLAGLALGFLTPCRVLERLCGARRATGIDDVVTVIFSSGSTGEPKGVMLSHFNVDSNVEAIAQVTRISAKDRLLGILPLFHSFGFTALWFATNHGLGMVFHPNPLDADMVGEQVQRYNVTIMIATPTFLQLYMRRCTPAQFGSLRMVVTGAEKLPERLATAFEDNFGIRPLEGYGTTECSPAVTLSTLDFRAPGFFQPGSRRGTVGQPLPGVSVRVVDPDVEFDPATSETLPPSTPGMLVVRGPNVMQGYLGRKEETEKALRGGWYVTGDIAMIDEDGFVKITGRLSRFSKIGGEMVPHGKVEECLHEAAGRESQAFAVTAVPDEKKGERLAVLHTLDENEIPGVVDRLANMGLPNLFIPKVEQFVKVEAIPVLGTGKLDLREIRRLATEALTAKQSG